MDGVYPSSNALTTVYCGWMLESRAAEVICGVSVAADLWYNQCAVPLGTRF